MLKYRFENKLMWGKPEPLIIVDAPYEMLCDLSNQWLSNTDGVSEVITELQGLLVGKQDIYKWGASDYCIIYSHKDKSNVVFDFGDSQTEVPTAELLKLMQDWKAYLESNINKP